MPTFSQLVKKGRGIGKVKSKSPALGKYFNYIQNRPVFSPSPFKRGVTHEPDVHMPRPTAASLGSSGVHSS